MPDEPADVASVVDGLAAYDYLADEGLATAVFLALRLQRPLFLEGDAGVGKTEVAKALAAWTGGRLVRLQCYEGIDANQALFEWDHARQLLHLRAAEAAGRAAAAGVDVLEGELYDERFLVRRPLLQALYTPEGAPPPVLLIDEIDRADDEFEAFLLELLSDWAVTIPELGTVRATTPPVAVLTSNRTPRRARRAQAPLPLPLGRPAQRRARGGDRAHPGARGRRSARSPGRVRRGRDPRVGAVQAAGHRRDHRLGPGAVSARRRATSTLSGPAPRWVRW